MWHQHELLQDPLSSVLNGRPVQISRGFAVSHHGSAVGETLQSLVPPAGNWLCFSGSIPPWLVLRDPNIKNHYSKNNYKKMRQMSEQARDKNA